MGSSHGVDEPLIDAPLNNTALIDASAGASALRVGVGSCGKQASLSRLAASVSSMSVFFLPELCTEPTDSESLHPCSVAGCKAQVGSGLKGPQIASTDRQTIDMRCDDLGRESSANVSSLAASSVPAATSVVSGEVRDAARPLALASRLDPLPTSTHTRVLLSSC